MSDIPDDILPEPPRSAEPKKEPAINQLFRLVMKHEASDLHLKVGSVPMMRGSAPFRLNSQRVVLHTRAAGDLSILLRKDTRYLADGQLVDADSLKPNMRVFVKAGKDLYNDVEAYQVIWGTILTPR